MFKRERVPPDKIDLDTMRTGYEEIKNRSSRMKDYAEQMLI